MLEDGGRRGLYSRPPYAANSAAEQEHEDLPVTPRELQVVKQVAQGRTNKQIADALQISVETVKDHVQNLVGKLGLNVRTQAEVWAVRRGLV